MPSALPPPSSTTRPKEHITKFTNCRLILNNTLVHQDLWISSLSGKIIRSQEAFYSQHIIPDTIIDLNNKILSPGFIDVQLNGAFGFDFSVIPDGGEGEYQKRFKEVNRRIVRTGVTSYLPTLTSQRKEVYHTVSFSLLHLFHNFYL
jgi:N-acetylglucosamine-6-phosphate deacetylase